MFIFFYFSFLFFPFFFFSFFFSFHFFLFFFGLAAAAFFGPDHKAECDKARAELKSSHEEFAEAADYKERSAAEAKAKKKADAVQDALKQRWVKPKADDSKDEDDEIEEEKIQDVTPNQYDGDDETCMLPNFKALKTVRSFFDHLFDDQVVDLLCEATNKTLDEHKAESTDKTKGVFDHLDRQSMRAFIAALIEMGITRKASIAEYFVSDPDRRVPAIANRWPKNRFQKLFAALSTDARDPSPADAKKDTFFRVRGFVNMLNDKFAAALKPGERLVVDETMIKFLGKHDSVQLMPKKPIKIGFKCWTLASVGGYVFRLELYEGKKDGVSDTVCVFLFFSFSFSFFSFSFFVFSFFT